MPRDVSPDSRGVRALYAELLREALRDADVLRTVARLEPGGGRSRSRGSWARSTPTLWCR
jgi:hypothetical protein